MLLIAAAFACIVVFASTALSFTHGRIPSSKIISRRDTISESIASSASERFRRRSSFCRRSATLVPSDEATDLIGSKGQDDPSRPMAPVFTGATKHDLATGRDPMRVKIFDTTLRDGEQSPGCTMNGDEKLAVAKQLAKLGVDVIEAGFPASSPGDFEAVKRIAQVVGNSVDPPIICGLARAVKKDVDACRDALSEVAAFPRLHLFIATSDIHMEHKLRKTREEVLALTTELVTYGKQFFEDIEFSGEDALRSDPDFLCQVFSAAIAAGATTINVPDTVGYTTPDEFKQLIRYIRRNVKGVEGVTISGHGHDDLGMGVANLLASVEGGARQLECTINGIGERAGNAALEELVMALHVRKSYYNPYFGKPSDAEPCLTNIKTQEIAKSSKMVSSITGMLVQANKAIVGANAFAHESGIHQDGVLKNKRTYEIMDAESIGLSDNNLVLGKHSGRHAFRSRINDLGYSDITDDDLNKAFVRFKDLADKKKEISNADLESLMTDEITQMISKDRFQLVHIQVMCGDKQVSTATLTILDDSTGAEATLSRTGTGPVDATFKVIEALTNTDTNDVHLLEYTVSSVTAGIDALGEVTVRLKDLTNGRISVGRSADTDVIVASAQAHLNALNRLESVRGQAMPTHPQFNSI